MNVFFFTKVRFKVASNADVLRGSEETRDEPLRTSALEAKFKVTAWLDLIFSR